MKHSAIAIYAAKHRKQWGNYATRQYCIARGVPINLYIIARTLEIISKKELHQ